VLRSAKGDDPIKGRWKLFEKYVTNMELIPYHSRGIAISSKLTDSQLDHLIQRFEENINFIKNFEPKLFIFNGSSWYSLLFKNKLISEFEKISNTAKFILYFIKIKDTLSVLFDKFFQRHFWRITNEDRRIKIPNLIVKEYPSILFK
jgi:dihydrofolate reductase